MTFENIAGQLREAFSCLADPLSDTSAIMNARTKLGYYLQILAVQDSERTLYELIDQMAYYDFSSTLSMTFIATVSFIYQFLPLETRFVTIYTSYMHFKKHVISDDSLFIQNFIKFLSAGGGKILPCKTQVVDGYLNILPSVPSCARLIGLLISSDPEQLSPYLWTYFNSYDINENYISLLAAVIFSCPTLHVSSDFQSYHQEVIKTCHSYVLNKENKFSLIEESLAIISYYIEQKMTDPKSILPIYSEPNLNSLAVGCWAKYAAYGDLSKIPSFSSDLTPPSAFLSLIVETFKNPSFSFSYFKVPHWLWESCLSEFHIMKSIESGIYHHSIPSLSIDELNSVVQMTHFLPSWAFVQCINSRFPSPDINIRILKIVGDIPMPIAIAHQSELFEYFRFVIKLPRIQKDLITCINDLFVPVDKLTHDFIKFIASNTDPFDENSLMNNLPILTDLLDFRIPLDYIMPIFYCIYEYFDSFNLSLSFLNTILMFFAAISPYLSAKYMTFISNIATVVIAAGFQENLDQNAGFDHSIVKVFKQCTKYYKVISSDLVFNPLYNLSDSLPLIIPALILISHIPTENVGNIALLWENLPKCIPISPVYSIYAILAHFSYVIKNQLEGLVQKSSEHIINILNYDEDSTIKIIATAFFDESIKFQIKYPPNIFQFDSNKLVPNDPSMTRILLKYIPKLMERLVDYANQLYLLFMKGKPNLTPEFIKLVQKKITEIPPRKIEKRLRQILGELCIKSPEYIGEESWIKRSLQNYKYERPELPDLTGKTTKEIIDAISIFIPIDKSKPENIIRLNAMRLTRKNPKYTKIYDKLVSLSEDLDECNFWLQRSKFNQKIQFEPVGGEKSQIFPILNSKEPILPESDDCDYIIILKLRNCRSRDALTISSTYESPTLEAMFLKTRIVLPQEKLSEMITTCSLASAKINLMNYMQFYLQTSPTVGLDKNELLNLFKVDTRNVFMFNSAFLASISTMKIKVTSATELINNFLIDVFKNAKWSSPQIYSLLPVLVSLYTDLPANSPGKKEIKKFFLAFPSHLMTGTQFEPIYEKLMTIL